MKIKPFKIVVNSLEEGIILQTMLFSIGCVVHDGTFDGCKKLIDNRFIYLYVDSDGFITVGSLYHNFNSHPANEMSNKFLNMLVQDARKLVVFGGKRYYKDELELALANITPVD